MLPPSPADLPRLRAEAQRLQAAGDMAAARPVLQRLLLAEPKSAPAWFRLGQAEAALGNRDAAEKAFRKALALAPREAAVWQALHGLLTGPAVRKLEREAARAKIPLGSEAELRPALAALARGEAAKAESLALAAAKASPNAFWPAFALGQARAAQGRFAAAAGPLRVAHDRDTGHEEARLAYGVCLARLGQPVKADAMLSPLIPRRREAVRALAQALSDTLQTDRAVALLDAVPVADRAAADWILRAEIEASRGAATAALDAVKKARVQGPAGVALLRRVAYHLRTAGDIDGARAALQAARAGAPEDAGVLTDLAQDLQSEGRSAEAEALLHQAIAEDADHAEAYRALAAGGKARAGDPLIDAVAARLAVPGQSRTTRRTLHFAAAKLAADTGAQAQVFDHLHRANRLMREAHPYDFEADLAEARRLVADWPALAGLPPSDAPADPVLFVTGLPRSGTTLVETILAAHPEVAAGGEMPFLNRALGPAMELLRDGHPDAGAFAAAGERYLTAARRRAGAAIFTDKAISTYSRIGHAVTALPGARIVILRRDPRDVGLSMYRNMFPEGLHRYTCDLTSIGRHIRLHDALVDFWAGALPDRVHIVGYEALTAEPEPHIRALVEFAGLPWDDACLAPERSARRVETLSFAQVRAPIGRSAVSGWRRYESDLAPLIAALEETEIDLRAPADPGPAGRDG